jgi:glycosyltransferase involved in cell wall biosynthesis
MSMNESTDIYIWGAGHYGVLTALYLKNKDIKIKGFIDKNAKAIKTKLDLRVLELNEIGNKNSQIIIAVQNEEAVKEIMKTLSLRKFKFEISLLIQNPEEHLEVRKKEALDFFNDFTKTHSIQSTELALYLDVNCNLMEENIFEDSMKKLFETSQKVVIICANNHKKFTDWVKKNKSDWKLLQFIPNKYQIPVFDNFYIFGSENFAREFINTNSKISILVPVYNVEKYLCKCLDSIVNQTYKNIEIICVNDASTDNSLAILNEYAQKDSRIVVIDKKTNKGLPQARQTAFINSSGEYIIPIDSDDYIELNMLEKLYYCAIFGNYDMVCCGYFEEKEGSTYTRNPQILPEDKIECIKYGIFNFGNAKIVWNKLVKRDVYEKVKFGKENNGEDCFITCQNLYHSQKTGYFPEPLYHWRYTGESLTTYTKIAQTRYEDRKINYEHIIDFCKEKFGNDLSIFEPELSNRIANIERQNPERQVTGKIGEI